MGNKSISVRDAFANIFYRLTAFAIFACTPAGFWYFFDDQLAYLVGIEDIGRQSFGHIWAACFFIGILVKSGFAKSNNHMDRAEDFQSA